MPGPVSIVFMPALLAATCTVRLWDPSSGHLRTIFAGHKGKVHDLAFIGSGTLLFSASKDKVFATKTAGNFLPSHMWNGGDTVPAFTRRPQSIIMWDLLRSEARRSMQGGHVC